MTKPHLSSSFVTNLNEEQGKKLLHDLREKEFEISTPPYTHFNAKSKGISCTLYQSGKLVVQGKESSEFIEFYLEPEILHSFGYLHPMAQINVSPRIGIDESGKGDFFGPLCIGGVFVDAPQFEKLQALGVKDSKTLSDKVIRKLAKEIKTLCLTHIVKINPPKYNQIYAEFKNLNTLLGWGHATAIEQLVEQSGCQTVIIDQFAAEHVVERALKRKKLAVQLTQRHRGEEDLAVAAASIIARAAFVEGLDYLSEEFGFELPKGSSKATEEAWRKVLHQWGEEKLRSICKGHFKTLDAILNKERQ